MEGTFVLDEIYPKPSFSYLEPLQRFRLAVVRKFNADDRVKPLRITPYFFSGLVFVKETGGYDRDEFITNRITVQTVFEVPKEVNRVISLALPAAYVTDIKVLVQLYADEPDDIISFAWWQRKEDLKNNIYQLTYIT